MTDLLCSDVEESLRESVRSTIARRLDPATVAGLYDAPDTDVSALWTALGVDLGLAGLLIPEKLGGAGATAREAAVVLEELGRAVAPVPFLTSSVIATTTLLAAGDTAHLPSIADGSCTAVLVLPWSARCGAWSSMSGAVVPVAGALGADVFLMPVDGADGVELRVLTAEQVEVEAVTSFDMSRPLATVTPRSPGDVLLSGPAARAAVDAGLAAGQALMASEQYGVARRCLESTVEHVKTRVQFARPLGSFQALKHRLADLYLKRAKSDQLALGTPARHRADLAELTGLTL